MAWKIETSIKSRGPYGWDKNSEWNSFEVVETERRELAMASLKLAKRAVADELDVADQTVDGGEFTRESIRAEFEQPSFGKLPDKSVEQIHAYYEFRRVKYAEAIASMEAMEEAGKPASIRIEIPENLSGYDVYASDADTGLSKKILDNWIEVSFVPGSMEDGE